MFGRFRNEAGGATSPSASSGRIEGPAGTRFDNGTSSDNSTRLPRLARDRMKVIRRKHDDATDLGRSITTRIQHAQEDRSIDAARVAQLQQYGRGYIGSAGNHPAMASARVELETAERKLREHGEILAELKERAAAASAIRQPLAQILRAIDGAMAALPAGTKIKDHGTVTPRMRKGESNTDALERLREELAKAEARRAKVETAPLTFEEAAPIAHAQLAELVERGRPGLYALAEAGLPIAWPMAPLRVDLSGAFALPAGDAVGHQVAGFGHGEVVDIVALLAWVHRDAMVRAIDAELRACCADGEPLTREQRAAKLAEIDAEILSLQREECALIEAADWTVPYRGDCDWRAVLGIEAPVTRSEA